MKQISKYKIGKELNNHPNSPWVDWSELIADAWIEEVITIEDNFSGKPVQTVKNIETEKLEKVIAINSSKDGDPYE